MQSISESVNQSSNQSIHQSINQSIKQSTNQSGGRVWGGGGSELNLTLWLSPPSSIELIYRISHQSESLLLPMRIRHRWVPLIHAASTFCSTFFSLAPHLPPEGQVERGTNKKWEMSVFRWSGLWCWLCDMCWHVVCFRERERERQRKWVRFLDGCCTRYILHCRSRL